MGATIVNVDNFARAETDAMLAGIVDIIGAVNTIHHDRELAPLDRQPVIRQNRDTLYSVAVIDISQGAGFTIPEFGNRYLSVMLINQDHYINSVFHAPGHYRLVPEELGSEYVVLAGRVLFDPDDQGDLALVHAIQDGMVLDAAASRPFEPARFDTGSHTRTRDALLALAEGLPGYSRSFGSADRVDPVHHLIGTASGWGGLPDEEAAYFSVFPTVAPGRYCITLRDVPADAFYSVSVYNADGYFEPGPSGRTNVNSVFGARNADGSMTVWLGDYDDGRPNVLQTPVGWNLLIRLYRPRAGDIQRWTPPAVETVLP